jgi:hypothetical protein
VVTNAGPVAVITDIHANLPGDRRVHLVHGSPRKVNEYLFEDKPARLYEYISRTCAPR